MGTLDGLGRSGGLGGEAAPGSGQRRQWTTVVTTVSLGISIEWVWEGFGSEGMDEISEFFFAL